MNSEGTDRLADMISATVGYLLSGYDQSAEWSDNPGWHGTSDDRTLSPKEGLTLLAYALLLRARLSGQEHQLPEMMLRDMSARVKKLQEAGYQPFDTDQDSFQAYFIGTNGQRSLGGYHWKLERLPFAIAFVVAWIDHLGQIRAPTADLVAARRALNELVKDAGPVAEGRTDFYRSELLYRLDYIK